MDSAIVTRDPEIMSGTLCFAGTRVPVKNLFDYLEGSSSLEEFLEDFPSVSRERAVAVGARSRKIWCLHNSRQESPVSAEHINSAGFGLRAGRTFK